MSINFLDLKKINQRFTDNFNICFQSFLDSGYYILGNNVNDFEKEFAAYCGVNNCIGVGNGLDALFLILKGYRKLGKLQKGDEVIVASNTYIATVLAIVNAGLTPVLVEPSDIDFNLDPSKIDSQITSKTKAIMVTHLYGQLANMEALNNICTTRNLILISDAAQAHGAITENGKKAGSLAHASGFSFYPSKNLGALGDGGAITTDNIELAEVIKKLRNYGTSSKYVNDYAGVNSRLDEIQAAFLRLKLRKLDNDNDYRRKIATRYLKEINNTAIELPKWKFSKNHVFHLFVIRTSKRESLVDYLNNKDIQTLIHYPIPLYKQQAFQNVFTQPYPITDKQCNEVLSIPISPVMEDSEVNYVINAINSF